MLIAKFFTRAAVITFSPILLAVIISGALSFGYNKLLKDHRDAVEHTLHIISAIDQLLLKLQDAETGQRGYIITGDDSYLRPFNDSSTAILADIREIRKLARDNSEQLALLTKVEELASAKVSELQSTIEARKNSGFAAAQNLVLQRGGKALMDKIRDVAGEMRSGELQLLDTRVSNARYSEKMTIFVTLGCVILSIVGRLIAFLLQARLAKA